MELQRVIDLLSIECECVSRDCDRNCAACDLVQEKNELISAYRHAIRTIQRQIPAHVTHEATLYRCPTCPSCKNVVGEVVELFGKKMVAQVAFCKFCGQKLDWSDENGEV